MDSIVDEGVKKSRMPARLDLAQSLSGLALGLFMWAHLLLVSSILLGKDAMLWVTHFLEGGFLRPGEEGGYPILVTMAAASVFFLFILHAGLAMRKFPADWKQHKIFRAQMKMMKHADTNQWYTQVVTGFIMFFLGSVHLYIMMSRPDQIGPYASSDRIVSQWMWPLYLVLLFAVELHGAVGLYRLAIKWDVFKGKNPTVTRKRLKTAKTVISVFFILLGLASLAAYIKIGIEHRDNVGERYTYSEISTTTTPEDLTK